MSNPLTKFKPSPRREDFETSCHKCGELCELGLEDSKGHSHCFDCFDNIMEAWHEDCSQSSFDEEGLDGLDLNNLSVLSLY